MDSSEEAESWDIFASMFGGIPEYEIDKLKKYWMAFPTLREALLENTSSEYCKLIASDIKKAIKEHSDIKEFESKFQNAFGNFDEYLSDELIDKMESLSISKTEEVLSENIFERMADIPLVDKYEAYQLLDDDWAKIAVDLEIIQTEGFAATKVVDPNMVIKKKDGKETEVQDGWKGHIIPFELVQSRLLSNDVQNLCVDENRMGEIVSEYEELMDAISEDDKQKLLDDDNASFVAKEVANACNEVFADISTPETEILQEYLGLSKAKDKLAFAEEHGEIDWDSMSASKNGTYGKAEINKYIAMLKSQVDFEVGTYEYTVVQANNLIAEEKDLKKSVKEKAEKLHLKTKETIENLSDEQVIELLKDKWIKPLKDNLMQLPDSIVVELVAKLEALAKKYETTFAEVEEKIAETEKSLSAMIDDLEGGEFDMLGLGELKKLLGGMQND